MKSRNRIKTLHENSGSSSNDDNSGSSSSSSREDESDEGSLLRLGTKITDKDKNKTEMYLDLEKLDEAAAMFGFLTSSGILSKHHVFYKQVHSFCSSAMRLVDEHVLPSLYSALTRIQHAIQFNCKPIAPYLLSGRG